MVLTGRRGLVSKALDPGRRLEVCARADAGHRHRMPWAFSTTLRSQPRRTRRIPDAAGGTIKASVADRSGIRFRPTTAHGAACAGRPKSK